MRYYSNFLLFEDFLEYLPTDSGIVSRIRDTIVSPQVLIDQESCGTFLGREVRLDFTIEGLIETSTGDRITRSRIQSLLGQGIYKTNVLHTSNCTSPNGVCRSCYGSTFPGLPVPILGLNTQVPSLYNTASEVFVGDGSRSEFLLLNNVDEFEYVAKIHNGVELGNSSSLDHNTVVLQNPLPAGDNLVVKLFKNYTTPLLWYFSKSHSAGLFGIKELVSLPLLVRESLYNKLLTPEIMSTLQSEIEKYDTIPDTYLDYGSKIHSPLEQALFYLYLYSIYANVE